VDGEAEERVELNSASLVISVSPLMVGPQCGNLQTQMWRKAHARDASVVQQILFASIWYCQRVERAEEILRREVITFSGLTIASSVYRLPYSI